MIAQDGGRAGSIRWLARLDCLTAGFRSDCRAAELRFSSSLPAPDCSTHRPCLNRPGPNGGCLEECFGLLHGSALRAPKIDEGHQEGAKDGQAHQKEH